MGWCFEYRGLGVHGLYWNWNGCARVAEEPCCTIGTCKICEVAWVVSVNRSYFLIIAIISLYR